MTGKSRERTAVLAALVWFSGVLLGMPAGCRGKEPTSEPRQEVSGKPPVPETLPPKGDLVEKSENPRVRLKTGKGDIVLELDRQLAPISVENFIRYAQEGAYNGTIFHRVIPGFMIQGGGFEPGMKQKPTRAPIRNEAANGLKNLRGTVAMARTAVVDSATSQFFINCKDNASLDHRGEDPRNFGYAVFGSVVEGMGVVDQIEKVRTGAKGMHQDVPLEDVVIESVAVEARQEH